MAFLTEFVDIRATQVDAKLLAVSPANGELFFDEWSRI